MNVYNIADVILKGRVLNGKIFLLVLCLSLLGFGADVVAQRSSPPKPTASSSTLYFHCFTPTYGRGGTEPKPPRLLLSMRVEIGKDFELLVQGYRKTFKGRVEVVDGHYVVECEGTFGSLMGFAGRIKLEQPFTPQLIAFSGAVFPYRCVLSMNADPKYFLDKQAKDDASLDIRPRKTTSAKLPSRNEKVLDRPLFIHCFRSGEADSRKAHRITLRLHSGSPIFVSDGGLRIIGKVNRESDTFALELKGEIEGMFDLNIRKLELLHVAKIGNRLAHADQSAVHVTINHDREFRVPTSFR